MYWLQIEILVNVTFTDEYTHSVIVVKFKQIPFVRLPLSSPNGGIILRNVYIKRIILRGIRNEKNPKFSWKLSLNCRLNV